MDKQIEAKELKTAIIEVLVFFDLFNQPLTLFEIYKYLSIKATLPQILDVLESSVDIISMKNGFYFLLGRDKIVENRFKKYNYFKRKIKIAKKFIKFIKFLPFVRAVAVSNIICDHNLSNEGDIDLLVVSSKNRIWLTRFFCAGLAKIMNIRPSQENKKDKICLSFYLSEENLNLEKYMYNQDDFYFIYWILGLEIILDKDNILKNILNNNLWLKKYLPNILISENKFFNNKRDNNNFLLNYLEDLSKILQLKIMPKELKCQSCNCGGVVLTDNIIKLFREDKRPNFISHYKNNLSKYLK
ncbi:MAG TPA: hypothetical protein PK686_01875 [bacterium]|nr:hypothetical protein [bacterium]HPV65416.1 hypothetical protein [bacterium]